MLGKAAAGVHKQAAVAWAELDMAAVQMAETSKGLWGLAQTAAAMVVKGTAAAVPEAEEATAAAEAEAGADMQRVQDRADRAEQAAAQQAAAQAKRWTHPTYSRPAHWCQSQFQQAQVKPQSQSRINYVTHKTHGRNAQRWSN